MEQAGQRCGIMATLKGFICYARADLKMVEAFHGTHLQGFENSFDVHFWRDLRKLEAGDHWDNEIGVAIAEAQVFLLLISPAWCASKYIKDTELPKIQAHPAGAEPRGQGIRYTPPLAPPPSINKRNGPKPPEPLAADPGIHLCVSGIVIHNPDCSVALWLCGESRDIDTHPAADGHAPPRT